LLGISFFSGSSLEKIQRFPLATYTIVSATKTPLDPGEVNAGQTITVNPGDVFIFDSTADADVNFIASGGGPHDFDIVFNDTVTKPVGTLKVNVGSDLTPTISIADNVDLSDVDIDAIASEGLTLNAGNGVSLNKLDGSGIGNDVITLGNDFTATGDWNTTGGDDVITAGDNATFVNIKTGSNSDTITFGDGATFNEIDTESGGDTIWMDDNATGNKIIGGSGDDYVRTGTNENITTIDGSSGGNDVYETQDASSSSQNFETNTVICFRSGTTIHTRNGPRAVQTLTPGDLVWTRDHGFCRLRWIGGHRVDEAAQTEDERVRPVRIRAGALGPNLPTRDLYVSQHHRMLLRSPIVLRMFDAPEILVAAKKLVYAEGIEIAPPAADFCFHHLVFDDHEILEANGAETESMLLAPESLKTLAKLGEMAEGSPLLADAVLDSPQISARPIIQKRSLIEQLIARSRKNGKGLCHPATDHSRPVSALAV
jgi:Hint domain-containing protein